MNDFPQNQLLVNYLLGICTLKERVKVEQWLEEDQENFSLLMQVARDFGVKEQFALPDKDLVKKELMDQITKQFSHAEEPAGLFPARHGHRQLLYKRGEWVKLAAIFLVISMTGAAGVFFGQNYGQLPDSDVRAQEIQQSTLSFGQTASLRFGDGSIIKLNGGSTLRYPKIFAIDRREVWLEGEGFFSIAQDENRPFYVHAGNTTTRVLGTSFNIKAYDGELELQIAVAEGSVMVTRAGFDGSDDDGEESILLNKNQWITYRGQTLSGDSVLEEGQGDIRDLIAWKDRVLVFRNKPFEQVAVMLEQWYGVNITIQDETLKGYIIEGEHQNVSLEEVLNSIEFVLNFEYTIKGNEVLIRNR